MRIPPAPHRWNVTSREATAIQRHLAPSVRHTRPHTEFRLVVGVDAAFSQDSAHCVAAAVVWDLQEGNLVETRTAVRPLTFPYVPGLLSFREAPAVLAALRKLRHEPDAIMCDAQGYAHPRRFGLACHIGVICKRPTLGCAKSVLVGEYREPDTTRGSRTALRHGAVRIGTVLRTRSGVKPVIVSVGHLIDLPTAERLVLKCAVKYRLPEPTRLADHAVAQAKREM
ncbi:MAG: endonuclease V [Gemmatimonadota bacterium]|nr:MAG: endonuclease V [Gemmatimonadota bacterium]